MLAIRIGRRWFVTSVRVAVARKSAFASEAPSESMSSLAISYERPPDVKRISTWPEGPLDVLNLTSKSKYSRVPDVAAYAPPDDEARMLPRPLVWLSFGAGEPVGETMRTRPTPLPTLVIADDGLDVVRAEGERRGALERPVSFTEKR